jgi:hypothetical protein
VPRAELVQRTSTFRCFLFPALLEACQSLFQIPCFGLPNLLS